MSLDEYKRKRDFEATPEPEGRVAKRGERRRFVVQEHHASILHWDFRLEIAGVLKSWSIPKGPSRDPSTKRLAVEVEDHPIGYLEFTGEIAEGNYGAGTVYQWDIGTFEPEGDDPAGDWERGALKFELRGHRLAGAWRLFRMKGREQNGKPAWLLQKTDDDAAVVGDVAEIVGEATPGEKRRVARSSRPRAVRTRKAEHTKKRTAAKGEAISLEELLALRKPSGDRVVDVDGTPVELTSLDRVYWPDAKLTKLDLLKYYVRIADFILPYLANRPAILQRFPRGIGEKKFFQHDLRSAPEFVRVARMRNEAGREIDYAVYTDLASLLYLVNLGTIEQHPWHSRVEKLERPDWLALDLDPKGAPWKNVLAVARVVGDVLADRDLPGFPKTSGSTGIHVYVPLEPSSSYERAAEVAKELATEVASRVPEIATVERSLAERESNQVYVDWLQNAHGKSMAAPFSARGKPKATVSMPLSWDQIRAGVKISDFTIKNAFRKLESEGDPWSEFFSSRAKLPRAKKRSSRG
jgi:bifunctional non-homologous end joining protein LigD